MDQVKSGTGGVRCPFCRGAVVEKVSIYLSSLVLHFVLTARRSRCSGIEGCVGMCPWERWERGIVFGWVLRMRVVQTIITALEHVESLGQFRLLGSGVEMRRVPSQLVWGGIVVPATLRS